jgi:5S rRNA maturation endonuclease (ribonuclease M5)/archaellum biogenesis ATPase FlaH
MTAEQYLKDHGITAETAKRFHLTEENGHLNIPIKNVEDKIIWVKKRNLDYNPDDPNSKKYLNQAGTKAALFNIRSHHDKNNIILTEGEMDAIRLDQERIPAISSTAGSNTFNQEFADQLKDKTIYIVYDNDEAGKSGIRKVLEYLPNAKILELPLDSHDICDFFSLHTLEEFKQVVREAKTKGEWERKYQPAQYEIITSKQLYDIEFPPEQWLIDKILPATGITMFVGESGVGKSFIALEVVRAIIEQDIFLDHFEIKDKGAVLIIDKENGLRRLQKRMKDMGVPASDDVYLLKYPDNFTLEGDREGYSEFLQSIARFIKEKQIKVIVLDSFVDVVVGSENDSGDTSKVFNALRSISMDVCWVILHHDAKPTPHAQKTAGQKTRGSSNIIAQVDNQFYIEKPRNSLKTINIEQGKSRDNEPVAKFAIEFVSDGLGNMCGFKYIGEVKQAVKMIEEAQEFVFQYLTEHPYVTKDDIDNAGQQVELTSRTLKDAIGHMSKKGIIDFLRRDGFGNKYFYFISQAEGGEVNG